MTLTLHYTQFMYMFCIVQKRVTEWTETHETGGDRGQAYWTLRASHEAEKEGDEFIRGESANCLNEFRPNKKIHSDN